MWVRWIEPECMSRRTEMEVLWIEELDALVRSRDRFSSCTASIGAAGCSGVEGVFELACSPSLSC